VRLTGLALLFFATASAGAFAAPWPEVAEQNVSVGVDTSAARINIDVLILAKDGDPAYRLICRGGNDKFLQELLDTKGIAYVPDMMCVLNPSTMDAEGSLLAEGNEATWHTRGQFRWSDLVGACGNYPEYGRVRHFRLRQMELSLFATDVRVANGKVTYFVFNVIVKPMPEVQSRYVESSGYLAPRFGNCDVRTGIEERWCRNAKFDMVPCAQLSDPGGVASPWPQVAEQSVAVGVDTSAAQIDIDILIRAKDGDPAYRLICRGGNDKFRSELYKAKHIRYVPDMMCVLNPGTDDAEQSLLSEGEEQASHTRGQFRWSELVGACGNYPEHGRARNFRLRQMDLTLLATDVRVAKGRVTYFVFNVLVKPMPEVQSASVESSGYRAPNGNCKVVRTRVERGSDR